MDELIGKIIANAVEDAGRYPFLFVGSGLSRRYANAPDWEGLLSTVCNSVLDDKYAFSRYRSQAKIDVRNGLAESELPHVATLMENDVNNALFSKAEFERFRTNHQEEFTTGTSPMKLYVADALKALDIPASEELDLLSKAGSERIAGVITTNYDRFCETVFPEFKPYVGEADLLFTEQCFSQEIYKIHGSVSNPESMVLTGADYAEFNRRRKYLAAKLLTIFIEYPVVFLGYSIQDENIKAILKEISECLSSDKMERLQRRMIFVQHGSETKIGTHSMAFGDKMMSMTQITTDDFASIYCALLKTRKTYSTKLLRELRGSVFRLAEKIDPASDIVVSGIDNVLNNLTPDQKLVVGLSLSPTNVGRPITPEDIFEDVVLDNLHYDPKFITEWYLNKFVRQLPNNMPVFKYVKDLDGEVGKDIATYLPKLTSLDSFRTKTIRSGMAAIRNKFSESLSINGLIAACNPKPAFVFVPYLEEGEIDVDELEAMLKGALQPLMESPDDKLSLLKDSYFRKCVRIYDFLRYHQ